VLGTKVVGRVLKAVCRGWTQPCFARSQTLQSERLRRSRTFNRLRFTLSSRSLPHPYLEITDVLHGQPDWFFRFELFG
jgi:hypothetical protein